MGAIEAFVHGCGKKEKPPSGQDAQVFYSRMRNTDASQVRNPKLFSLAWVPSSLILPCWNFLSGTVSQRSCVCVRFIRSSARTRCGWVPRCWWCCYVDPVSRRKHNKSPVWKRPQTRRGNRQWPSPLSPKSLLTCWRVWPAALRGSSASASRPRAASRRSRRLVCQPLSCWSSIERYNLGHRCLPWLLFAHSSPDSWASCPPSPIHDSSLVLCRRRMQLEPQEAWAASRSSKSVFAGGQIPGPSESTALMEITELKEDVPGISWTGPLSRQRCLIRSFPGGPFKNNAASKPAHQISEPRQRWICCNHLMLYFGLTKVKYTSVSINST